MPEDDTLAADGQDTATQQASAPEADSAAPAPEGDSGSEDAQVETQPEGSPSTDDPDALNLTQKQTDETKPAEEQAPPQSAAKPVDPAAYATLEKRLRDQQSYFGRQLNEWRERYQKTETEKQTLARFKAEQEERSKAAALPIYSKQHPEHGKFRDVLTRAQVVERQIAAIPKNLPVEQQEAMAQAMMSALSEEDRAQIDGWREHTRKFNTEWASDPHGTIAGIAVPLIQQEIQSWAKRMQEEAMAQQRVAKDYDDPDVQEVIKTNPDMLREKLENGSQYDDVITIAKQNQRIAQLEAQLKGHKSLETQARAQASLRSAKDEASIHKDPRKPPQDPYILAKKRAADEGVPPGSMRFNQILQEIIKG